MVRIHRTSGVLATAFSHVSQARPLDFTRGRPEEPSARVWRGGKAVVIHDYEYAHESSSITAREWYSVSPASLLSSASNHGIPYSSILSIVTSGH